MFTPDTKHPTIHWLAYDIKGLDVTHAKELVHYTAPVAPKTGEHRFICVVLKQDAQKKPDLPDKSKDFSIDSWAESNKLQVEAINFFTV